MERGSQGHLEAISGKKEKPETAALRAEIAKAQVRDTMNKLVNANSEQMRAHGWSGSEEKPIPPPPIPEVQKLPRKRKPAREEIHDQAAA